MSLFQKSKAAIPVLLMVACVGGCGGGSGSTNLVPPVVQTVKFQPDGTGSVQFYTNDSQYYGYGIWNTTSLSYESQMSTATATVTSKSGARGQGHGVIFCDQDTNNYYTVSIDAIGHYTVGSRVGGTYTQIIPWRAPASSVINAGAATNVISVTQQPLHTFTISFNGVQETQFTDQNFTGGRSGFYMTIGTSSIENFPWIAEDVRFKMTSPITYPAATGVSGIEAVPAPSGVSSFEAGVEGATSTK